MPRYTSHAYVWKDFERAAAEARQEARPAPITAGRAATSDDDERIARARLHPLWPIAIHEAGHAVIASVCAERRIRSVTIAREHQPDGRVYSGYARFEPGADDPRLDALYEITIALAGTIAEGRVMPSHVDVEGSASSDIDLVLRLDAEHHLDIDVKERTRFTRQMVDGLWPEIEEVAADLIEKTTVGDDEVRAAIARATARNPRYLRKISK